MLYVLVIILATVHYLHFMYVFRVLYLRKFSMASTFFKSVKSVTEKCSISVVLGQLFFVHNKFHQSQ